MDDYLKKPSRHMVERIDASPEASGCRAGASAGPGQGAPFDVEELLGRCLGDPAFLANILAVFRKRAAAMLQDLEDGVAARDARVVARVAHGIKGAAANLSAPFVRELAAELEDLGNAGCLDGARQFQDELRERLQECIDYIPRALSDAETADEE